MDQLTQVFPAEIYAAVTVGAVVSIVKLLTLSVPVLPAASVLFTVQLLCTPGANAVNVIVLFPEATNQPAVVLQSHQYTTVPVSLEL